MRRLPPLNSLRSFEATARHLSFSKAADELNVTPGAVSQQVKALEDYLSLKLFKRKNRMILLTDEAQVCLPYLTEGLDRLAEGIDHIRSHNADKPLAVTVSPTFASRWLLPRLNNFHQCYPDIDVRIDATNDLADLVNDDIDIGIRFGTGDYSGLEADYLFSQEVFPVCSPELLAKGPKLEKPQDLKHYTLLHGDYYSLNDSPVDWDMWFATVGIDCVDTSHGLHFTQHDLVIEAAIQGQGVALAGSISVGDDLKKGRLMQLFESRIPLEFSYYFVCSKTKLAQDRIQAFRQWLLDEAKKVNDR